MGKKLLSLLLLCCLSVTAGEVEHITTDAEYFDPQTMEFYFPQNGGRYRIGLMLVSVDNSKFSYMILESGNNVDLKKYLYNNGKTESSLINLKKQKSGYPPGYGPQLDSISFDYDSGTDVGYSEWSLRITDPNYALIHGRWGDRNGNGHSWRGFYNYGAACINNTVSIYAVNVKHKDHRYIIINIGKSYSIYTNNPEKPVPQQTDADLSPFLRQHYPYGTFTENGKQGLKMWQKTIIAPVYDSIITTKEHIITYRNHNIQLFYSNGDTIAHGTIRATYRLIDISVLIDNTAYTVNPDGSLGAIEVTPLSNVSPPAKQSEDNFNLYGKIEIIKSGDGWKMLTTEPPPQNAGPRNAYTQDAGKSTIIKGGGFASVTFANGTTGCECLPPYYGDYLIAETHNGFKTLLKSKSKYLSPRMPENYTVVLEPGNYTFFNAGQFVGFKKDGLWGYFPLNKEVRYTELSGFTNGFARFTLPDGTQGWLAKDGTEYLDQ